MTPHQLINAEELQRDHYEQIAADYEAHYDDPCSHEYRDLFFHTPMFDGLDLHGWRVLEAMCGTGSTVNFLLQRGAHVTGLDVSPQAIAGFRARWPQAEAVCSSLLDSGLPDNSFDCIAVVGGLHHLPPNLHAALHEMHRVLRPGGWLCFAEPHAASPLDALRQLWYRHDPLFASNEAAIEVTAMEHALTDQFHFRTTRYGGSIAYLAVLNSLVLRLPLSLKRFYTPLCNWLEARITPWQSARTSCFVICQWQKRAE